MDKTVTITAPNGSTLKLVWHAADAKDANPVTIYQNSTYAGVHTTAQAEKAIANARTKGLTITQVAEARRLLEQAMTQLELEGEPPIMDTTQTAEIKWRVGWVPYQGGHPNQGGHWCEGDYATRDEADRVAMNLQRGLTGSGLYLPFRST